MTIVKRPAPFVLVSTGHGTLIANHNDVRMDSPDSGFGVGYQLFTTSYFDPEEVDTAVTLLKSRREFFGDGVVALDCGANIGVHTIEWAKAMYGWGSVVAVEAQLRIFYALAGNIAINNCFNATAFNVAIGGADGELSMPVPDYTKPSSFGSLELRRRESTEFIGQEISYDEARCDKIRLIAIDSIGFNRMDFIKLDIEGMELEALKGADQTIQRWKPILLVEWIKSDKQALIELLAGYGYKVYELSINLLAVHESDPTNSRIQITP
jgi:FkbM family methyltransferase